MICFFFFFYFSEPYSKFQMLSETNFQLSLGMLHISTGVFVKTDAVIESNENFISEQLFNLCYKGLKSRGDFIKSCCPPYHRYMEYT